MKWNNITLEKAYNRRAKDLSQYGTHISSRRDNPITRRVLWLQLLGLMETARAIDPS